MLSCLWYCKSTIFQANHNCFGVTSGFFPVVCDTAKVRFFKQITTCVNAIIYNLPLFVILQKYDFSSKSQPISLERKETSSCLWYCKSTIFQANHNDKANKLFKIGVVCDTAKVRFFKQITTYSKELYLPCRLFVILQKYDFSSKSQRSRQRPFRDKRCLWYCKSTIFQANHNEFNTFRSFSAVVCDTAKVRFFKQITTRELTKYLQIKLFVILQKYDFSSKSQRSIEEVTDRVRCLWYCKSTIFQANHNMMVSHHFNAEVVCDTAKVRFFKQITTVVHTLLYFLLLFVILQKYDFSSKSQPILCGIHPCLSCLWYCKSTIFQANHNTIWFLMSHNSLFVILQKYDFSSKSQPDIQLTSSYISCLWYCKSTIFQANHNISLRQLMIEALFVILQKYDFSSKSQQRPSFSTLEYSCLWYCKSTIFQANHNLFLELVYKLPAVCDTAKVRFFKQITTKFDLLHSHLELFVILQKYDFSSKSQLDMTCVYSL